MNSKEPRLAHFYDLEYRDFKEDLDFYVQFALQMDPKRRLPVLELGCGTGRVSIALAKAGFRVVGVDTSEEMLAVSRQGAEENGVHNKVTLIHSDMGELASELVPEAPFNLALCALNTFAYLKSTAEQLKVLRCVHPLLVQHGILLIDLTAPLAHLLPTGDGEVVHQGSFADVDGAMLHKFVTGVAHPATQTHDVTVFYDLEAPDGTLNRTSQVLNLRSTGRYEMELLLQAAGYKVERVYGDYELGDYVDESERMIFVART